MKALNVTGRRWFNKGPGNTYHSVIAQVDGETVVNVGYNYAYGDSYIDTAKTILFDKGLLPDLEEYRNGSNEPLWRYCRRKNIIFTYSVADVNRRKDL